MKTDNSYYEEKLYLREKVVRKSNAKKVLDAYAGSGTLWNEIKLNHDIDVVSIEKEKGKNIYALQGDNLKYLPTLDLNSFDVIDLDAYGVPYEQLEILFDRNYKGYVIVTSIQSNMGRLPNGILWSCGYTNEMIKKIPTLFTQKGFDKIKNYLYLRGVKEIEGYFFGLKNYFYFKL